MDGMESTKAKNICAIWYTLSGKIFPCYRNQSHAASANLTLAEIFIFLKAKNELYMLNTGFFQPAHAQ